MQLRNRVQEAVDFLAAKGIEKAEIGFILGTGLGDLVKEIEIETTIEYADIPHFEVATVETHQGKLIFGKLAGKTVICMQGRYHYYEGYNMQQITFPLYVMKMLGIAQLFMSNAAGNLNHNWNKGDLMVITDHINLQPENPLRGHNDASFGPRFPDMSRPYNEVMGKMIVDVGKDVGVEVRTGVYVSVVGPNLETKAEYRYLRSIGADAVGMSTVPEVIVANYLGIPVCAVSVLTDDCDPDNLTPVNIADILAIAGKAEKVLTRLIINVLQQMN